MPCASQSSSQAHLAVPCTALPLDTTEPSALICTKRENKLDRCCNNQAAYKVLFFLVTATSSSDNESATSVSQLQSERTRSPRLSLRDLTCVRRLVTSPSFRRRRLRRVSIVVVNSRWGSAEPSDRAELSESCLWTQLKVCFNTNSDTPQHPTSCQRATNAKLL